MAVRINEKQWGPSDGLIKNLIGNITQLDIRVKGQWAEIHLNSVQKKICLTFWETSHCDVMTENKTNDSRNIFPIIGKVACLPGIFSSLIHLWTMKGRVHWRAQFLMEEISSIFFPFCYTYVVQLPFILYLTTSLTFWCHLFFVSSS